MEATIRGSRTHGLVIFRLRKHPRAEGLEGYALWHSPLTVPIPKGGLIKGQTRNPKILSLPLAFVRKLW